MILGGQDLKPKAPQKSRKSPDQLREGTANPDAPACRDWFGTKKWWAGKDSAPSATT